jgi:hypothetical protein
LPIRDKGRPRSALSSVVRITKSSTCRYPSAFKLPSNSAPAVFNQQEALTRQLFVVNSGLKQPSTTALAIARLQARHINQYKPGTQHKRAYMCDILSIYKEDYIDDVATVATRAISDRINCINGIEVFTQDTNYKPDDNF